MDGCFSKAHVLCNDGNSASIISQSEDEPTLYSLFFAMNTADTDLNDRTGFNQMNQDFMPITGGKYCGVDMFDTMTFLQSDLNSNSFDWTCKSNQLETDCETLTSCYESNTNEPTFKEAQPDPATVPSTSEPTFNEAQSDSAIVPSDSAPNTCTGSPGSCIDYSYSDTVCKTIAGCGYLYGGYCTGGICQNPGCYGAIKACNTFDGDKEACINQGRCVWNDEASSGVSTKEVEIFVGIGVGLVLFAVV